MTTKKTKNSLPDTSAPIAKKTKEKLTIEEVHIDETEGMDRYPDVFSEHRPGTIRKHNSDERTARFACDQNITLQIEILTPTIFHIRYSVKALEEPHFSYAIDPDFEAEYPSFELKKKADAFVVQTDKLRCRISKQGMQLRFSDKQGQLISQEEEGFYAKSTLLRGINRVRVRRKALEGEAFFGLGDKAGSLNLRGQKHSNFTTDSFGFGPKTKELYRAIPFFYGLYEGRAYGIFLDNTYRSHFDFDSASQGISSFGADGGCIDYYFIYGPELTAVASQYALLTGRPELPPLWALGYHQCRWSYFPENRVLEVAEEFRKRKIPCDAIYLDIDYMDGYRCFSWNKEYFPDPAAMIELLKNKGFQTVVMIDPGIKVDEKYLVFKEGMRENVFCRRPDGALMIGPVWPSQCVWPDFTNPKVRAWWGKLYHSLYNQQNVSGFWNDMNEPAVFKLHSHTFPEDVRHHLDGHPCSHRKAHNVYGLCMSRATFEGLKELKPNKRPFVLTRASFAGGQRFASSWTGDNIASWKHLRIANRQCQRMSISGFSFIGSDIGGFAERPDGELFVRWLQLGVFHPFFRVHSMGNHMDGAAEVDKEAVKKSEAERRLDQEPWSFGDEFTIHAKAAIELRYQLLPYIYTSFWKYVTTGRPMIQSLAFYDQQDSKCVARQREFLFGEHILVSPVQQAGQRKQYTYLPKGKWYNYWTGKAFTGRQKVQTAASIGQIPFFIKAGAVIPKYPVIQHTGAMFSSELNLHIFCHNKLIISQLYEDKGEGYGYQKGKYCLRTFSSQTIQKSFSLKQKVAGKFKLRYPSIRLHINGLPFKPGSCAVDGKATKFQLIEIGGIQSYALTVPVDFAEVAIKE